MAPCASPTCSSPALTASSFESIGAAHAAKPVTPKRASERETRMDFTLSLFVFMRTSWARVEGALTSRHDYPPGLIAPSPGTLLGSCALTVPVVRRIPTCDYREIGGLGRSAG